MQNIILSFSSLIIVTFTLFHALFLFKKFKNEIFKPFLILFSLFSLLSITTCLFFLSSIYYSIEISKLFLVITILLMSSSIFFSIQYNAKNCKTNNKLIQKIALLLAGSNIGCIITFSYNYLTKSFSPIPIISTYCITILFVAIIIVLPFFKQKETNHSIVNCLLEKKLYFNLILIGILSNDFHQVYLNMKNYDLVYTDFYIMYYFIFHCTYFLFKGHSYLIHNQKENYSEKVNADNVLSVREKEIAQLLISGKSNNEIASELFISLPTVKTHNSKIFKKLNIKSRYELILKFS